MSTVPERRRRLSADERRASIIAAAAAEFERRTPEDVTVAEVASAAGTSQPLVFHYFPTKAELYAGAVAARLGELTAAVSGAVGNLPASAPAREQVRATVLAHLDHVARHRAAWASSLDGVGGETSEAAGVREDARVHRLALLSSFLLPDGGARRHYALAGHVAHVDGLSREWVRRDCPADERWDVVETALGALQGALGDWGR